MSPTVHPIETTDPLMLSVVVPTHGRVDLFFLTLASLEKQTLDAFEIVVTDDSKQWKDRSAIQEATMDYSRRTGRPARYLFSTAGLGQAKNTNQGLMAARGRFVRILHSDDLLAPQALEAEVALLNDSRLNLDVLYHLVEAFTDTPRFNQKPSLTMVQPSLFFRSCLHSGTPLPSATVFRRELLDEIGGMREDFDFLCDWEFFVRLLTSQYRRHKFLGRLTPGFIGWRVHPNSTTGKLWHRHFLEHEQFMNEMRADREYSEAMIGDEGYRDGFYATAVRYRYRRLADDASKMSARQLLSNVPMLIRCALSPASLRDRLTPAPWEPRGAKKYPNLVVQCDVPMASAPARPAAQASAPAPAQPTFVEPRQGFWFAASAYASAAIIRWGKQRAADYQAAQAAAFDPASFDFSSVPALAEGPAPLAIGPEVEVHHSLARTPNAPGTVRIVTEYNNSINFWALRQLIRGAASIKLFEVNSNIFVEPVIHQSLKFVSVGSKIQTTISDNQHLTSFGFKSLLDRLFNGQFAWSRQEKGGPLQHTLCYERKRAGHRTYMTAHTGWTFGILTTGARLGNVEQFIDSVERYCKEPYEILIVSPVDLGAIAERHNVRVLNFAEHDDLGWITRKKNLICEEAAYSDILVCHDRFTLDPQFTTDFAAWGYAYGLAAVRVRLEDGQRALDWAVVSSQNQVWSAGGLLDYRAYSQYAYNPGGATLIRKAFWRDFPWNENLFWNEHEDVELCRRVQRAGGVIGLTAASVVATEDRWIHHNPRIPYCDQNEVLYGKPVGEQRIHFLPKVNAA